MWLPLLALAALIWLAWIARAGLLVARIFQIEEYEASRLIHWSRQRTWLVPRALQAGLLATCLAAAVTAIIPSATRLPVLAGGWCAGLAMLHVLWRSPAAKKPLVYTPRARRLLGAAAVLAVLAAAVLLVAVYAAPFGISAILVIGVLLASPALAVTFILGGNTALKPVETRVRVGFVRKARAKLEQIGPTVVGVAGSYGKTSTKHITARFLQTHAETLPTPKSFNTLMGITRTINDNLERKHRIFVVEMDAYGPGEIESMCDLVRPAIAVVTSVGPQHLERFKTVSAIAAAIYELVASLPREAPAVIYAGDADSAGLADRAAAEGHRVIRYGLEGLGCGPLDVTAGGVVITDGLTRFTFRWEAQGISEQVAIPLLGEHNILNVSAALVVTQLLGGSIASAVEAARSLEPVPNRLQLIRGAGGVTIIDDSYNANPVGMHNGLKVLAQMDARARILVTPGMVELGTVEDSENQRLGEHAAQVCDRVLLVGAVHTRPILAGLHAAGFSGDRIHVMETLDEVTATLRTVLQPGDVVLFANDLPDTYLELE